MCIVQSNLLFSEARRQSFIHKLQHMYLWKRMMLTRHGFAEVQHDIHCSIIQCTVLRYTDQHDIQGQNVTDYTAPCDRA